MVTFRTKENYDYQEKTDCEMGTTGGDEGEGILAGEGEPKVLGGAVLVVDEHHVNGDGCRARIGDGHDREKTGVGAVQGIDQAG